MNSKNFKMQIKTLETWNTTVVAVGRGCENAVSTAMTVTFNIYYLALYI